MFVDDLLLQEIEQYLEVKWWERISPDSWTALGTFRKDPDRESEELARRLIDLGFYPFIRRHGVGEYEVTITKVREIKKSKFRVHAILFLLTLFTTILVGTLQVKPELFKNIKELFLNLHLGIPFSFTLLLILGTHEFGHYYLAKVHRVDASLPYFIPFPHPLLGTLGAFIRIKSPIPSRKALFDIGVAGPLGGAIVAIPLTIIGLKLSRIAPIEQGTGGFFLGDSLLFKFLTFLVVGNPPEGHVLIIHPMAFAGWLGLFVTALNLIPVGQLDGGHIAYAVLGKNHRIIARVSFMLLVFLGFMWFGWWTWAFLLFILGIDHPSPLNEVATLDRKRRILGVVAFLLFILTFMPAPFLSAS